MHAPYAYQFRKFCYARTHEYVYTRFKNYLFGYYNILLGKVPMMRMILKKMYLAALLLMFVVSRVDAKVPDIVLNQRSAVVTVYVEDGNKKHIESGTGIIADQDGVIVTNCRIIGKWIMESGATLSVEIEGKGRFPVEEVISSKCENNLALLKIKATDLSAVKIAPDFKPRQGEYIYIIKGRLESETAVSSGTIRSVDEKSGAFQISVPVKQRDSGSPLFNAKGEVVGAVIVQTRRGKTFIFAVSMKEISKQLGRYKKPKNLIDSNISQAGTDKAPEKTAEDIYEHFSRGCAYDQSGMYKEAIEAYQQSLKINPDFAETYVNLGIDYYRLGKYDDAINIFKQAIQIKPDIISVYIKLGATYIVNGEYSMAADILKKAIDMDPGNPAVHFNLGIAYFLSGDTIAAQEECTVLRDIDKTKADSLIDLMY